MTRLLLAFAMLASAAAQGIPRAQPVDPALENNPAVDFYQHGRNVYESAKRSNGPMQEELFFRSMEIFSRYLDRFPNHPNAQPARWYLGESFYALGRVEDAKRCYHQLLNLGGRNRYAAAAAYKLGADYFNRQQYALAATLFDKLSGIATTDAERQRGLYYAGLSYQLLDRNRQALTYFRSILDDPGKENPYAHRARLAAGKILVADGKLQEAIDRLDPLVTSQAPMSLRAEAALQAGMATARLGQRERSKRFFNRILNTSGMEAFRPDAQIALMAADFEAQLYRDVVRTFQRSNTRGEGEREIRRLMLGARAYMMLNRDAEALPLFREVERLSPPESTTAFDAAYYRLLCFYRIEGRHVLDQVDAFLQLYADRHPRDPKIHTARLMKAETLYTEGRTEDAANAYREINAAAISDKNRPGMLYQRGRCLVEIGDNEGAIASLSAFLEETPDDSRAPLARAARAKALTQAGEAAKALTDYRNIIEHSDDPQLLGLAYLESAGIHKKRNELDAMIRLYRGFLENVPSADRVASAKASYWAGWGLVKTDRPGEARPLLSKARELAPDAYSKHAGLLLCLAHLAEKKAEPLIGEVRRAIEGEYAKDLPEPLVRWAADQAFNAGNFGDAARFYSLIADTENPELVPKETWRFLGKARILSGQPEKALDAIEYTLAAEQDPAWRADALADRGRALLDLEKLEPAAKAAEEGLALRPEGRIGASLYLLRGDILMAQGSPEKAVQSYILPVQLMDDNDRVVKPEALSKLITALEKIGKSDDAQSYRQQLRENYPDWEPR